MINDPKSLWPDIRAYYNAQYERQSLHYSDLFGPSTPPSRWQRMTYALWRKHWYRFTDWLRERICGC